MTKKKTPDYEGFLKERKRKKKLRKEGKLTANDSAYDLSNPEWRNSGKENNKNDKQKTGSVWAGFPCPRDIIKSPYFSFGYYEFEDSKKVLVDGVTKKCSKTIDIDEDERVAMTAKTGNIPPKQRVVELGAYDSSRASAEFVVEGVADRGGGDQGDEVIWYVEARRLDDHRTYNPNGEVICFYMTGLLIGANVPIVGKMELPIKRG